MDRRPSRFSSGRDQEDYSDRRNSRQRNFGRERSPPERGRPSPPPIRGRSPGGRGRASPGRARSPPGRDRSPLRNRSPFRGGSAGGRNDFSGSRRPHQDSQRSGSYGDVPPFPNDPSRRGEAARFGDRRGLMPVPPGDLGPKLPPSPPDHDGAPSIHCELIVVNFDGRQRLYAESIRSRLASGGLSAEVIPVRASGMEMSVVLTSAVQDAVRRRALFACIINEQNEMHRSMTVNILHGQLQEHRNMPLDSAVSLIMSNYEQWLDSAGNPAARNAPPSEPPTQSGRLAQPSGFRPPDENIIRMLQMAIDGRCLVVEELDEVISYFEQQRKIMAKTQGIAPSSKPPGMLGDSDGERGRQDLQMMEKDPSLMLGGKAVPGQGAPISAGDYRKHSRFTDTPSGREMADKHGGGFPPDLLRPPTGPSDNRSPPFSGYGQAAPSSAGLAQSGVGDFRGLQDKMQSLYPGSQASAGGPGMDTHQNPTSLFNQPPSGGMSTYARPPPASAPPAPGFGTSGPHWAGALPLGASNGRQDWRPGFGSGPSSSMSDYHNPVQQQPQRLGLMGNWQPDAMSFSRFH